MNHRPKSLALVVLIVAFLAAQTVLSQEQPEPDATPKQATLGADPLEKAVLLQPTSSQQPQSASETGGPDQFGYTWHNDVPYVWPDATQGTRSNVDGDDEYGFIDFGFNFPFYEQNWNGANISTNGLLIFGEDTSGCCGNVPMPLPSSPNNVIAPFWSDLVVRPELGGGIWILEQGAAPNRSIVIEWHNASFFNTDGLITFAVELHENGDIIMYYMDLAGKPFNGTKGIEDSTGTVGLSYDGLVENESALAFTMPAAGRGALVYPLRNGRLTSPGASEPFELTVRNIGRLGTDTFDLTASSDWPVVLSTPDGDPLPDSDDDGTPDTGPLAQGAARTLLATVTVPSGTSSGDHSAAVVTAVSAADSSRTASAVVETAVPASFAHTLIEDVDYALGLNVLQPAGTRKTDLTVRYNTGYDPAVGELMAGGFATVWSRGWATAPDGSHRQTRLLLAMSDRYGDLDRDIQLPFSPGEPFGGVQPTLAADQRSALAVSPDNGHIGLVWQRFLYDQIGDVYNYNIYFALFDGDGNQLAGPLNVSAHTSWFTVGSEGATWVGAPGIAAIEDGRFVLSWLRDRTSNGSSFQDVYVANLDSSGSLTGAPQKVTDDPGDDVWTFSPSIASAPDNRATVFYLQQACPQQDQCVSDIYYTTLDEQGEPDGAAILLTDEQPPIWNGGGIDTVLLNNGRTLAIWRAEEGLRYALLGPQQTVEQVPRFLSDSRAELAMDFPALAASGAEQGVITWSDEQNTQLFYALLDSTGTVLSPPQVAYAGRDERFPYVSAGDTGQGVTSVSWQPPSGVDGALAMLPVMGAAPGSVIAVPLTASNLGASPASAITLDMTLPDGVTYVSDNSGAPPLMAGDELSWTLPGLSFLEEQHIVVRLQLDPAAAIGSNYSAAAGVSTPETDANDGNNSAATRIMAAQQIWLPAISRP